MARKRSLLRDLVEASGAVVAFAFFRLLPLDWASGLGGFLARTVGPRLGISKRARENLRLAMPELATARIETIIRGMWDNLGRVSAEYAQLRRFHIHERIEIVDPGKVLDWRPPGRRYIFFSAHCGNWEIAIRAAMQLGFAVTAVYRAANNPLVDRLIAWARSGEGNEFVPKGGRGAHRALAALREGRELCMLIDQKMNDGIAVPFFGREVMTAPALAVLALRYDCITVPVRIERLDGARFRMIVDAPLALSKSDDPAADRLRVMTEVNRIIEGWIRARPEQWLWLHRRWPD